MDRPGAPGTESIGELFARLVDDGRALVGAELALFRLDFYQRIGRAKTGILLCLIGAIMGQAAAVVLLISIAYGLAPWLGGFGGAAVAALIGAATAFMLLRTGARRLTMIVDDDPPEKPSTTVTMNELSDRARSRSQAARAQLAGAVSDVQTRLNPHTLLAEIWDDALEHGKVIARHTVKMMRRRPIATAAIFFTVTVIAIRPPIGKMLARIGRDRATGSDRKSLKGKRAIRPARPLNEETTP